MKRGRVTRPSLRFTFHVSDCHRATSLTVSKSHPIYKGRIVDLRLEEVTLPNGTTVTLEMIRHPGAAAIVAVDGDGSVALVHQFRHAAGGFLWEIPAGTLEHGEAPLACAKREIIEETGFKARKWKKLVSFYPAPGISTEFMHIFLASGLVPKPTKLDQDEYLEKHIVSFSRLQKMIFNGSIVDAKTIISFFYLLRDRKQLNKR